MLLGIHRTKQQYTHPRRNQSAAIHVTSAPGQTSDRAVKAILVHKTQRTTSRDAQTQTKKHPCSRGVANRPRRETNASHPERKRNRSRDCRPTGEQAILIDSVPTTKVEGAHARLQSRARQVVRKQLPRNARNLKKGDAGRPHASHTFTVDPAPCSLLSDGLA